MGEWLLPTHCSRSDNLRRSQKQARLPWWRASLRWGQPPVLLTAFTTEHSIDVSTILALMPLALGLGAGSEMQRPLAITIISGLVVAVPLVLLGMPSLFLFYDRLPQRWRRRAAA